VPSIDTFFVKHISTTNTGIVEQDDLPQQQLEMQTVNDLGAENASSPPPLPPEAGCCSSWPQSAASSCCTFSESQEEDWMYKECDPALWGAFNEKARSVLTERGSTAFQNRRNTYPASLRDGGLGGKARSLTNDLFTCHLPNREKLAREWLLYSPSTGNVFCFACMLFSSKKNQFVTGFSDWKHPERVRDHEKSLPHMTNMLALCQRSSVTGRGTMNARLVQELEGEKRYWREVLKRVIVVIKFLCERGLPFRGDDELLGSPHNGNYLGILEVITHFDPFFAEHVSKYGHYILPLIHYVRGIDSANGRKSESYHSCRDTAGEVFLSDCGLNS
jgi:hypothetical protein